jgi:hypothetical protein
MEKTTVTCCQKRVREIAIISVSIIFESTYFGTGSHASNRLY